MTPMQIYVFTRLDSLRMVFGVGCFFSFVVLIAMLIALSDDNYEDINSGLKRVFKLVSLCLIFFVSGIVFVPSQKQMALIYVLPKIATAENITKLTDTAGNTFDIVKMSSDYMKEIIERKEQNK